MRCPHCQAPRLAASVNCPYCGGALTSASSQPATSPSATSTAAWDTEFVRMRRQSRTDGLLRQREGLATPPALSAAQQFAPLILTGAIAAIVTWSRRADDGSFATRDLAFAGLVIALGVAASARSVVRAKRLAAEPVEGLLVRVGEYERGAGEPDAARPGAAQSNWIFALEDGTQRAAHPVPGARGAERLARGARGVIWIQGARLLGFEPID